jgi:two-component system, NtrC family, sensor kinase
MNADTLYERYQELQRYVSWSEDDAKNVVAAGALLKPYLAPLIEDFYEEIERHPDAKKVITGGAEQVARLKGTLLAWLHDLFTGVYDRDYVSRRWRVGWRHVEISLDQVYANVALSRLRRGLMRLLEQHWEAEPAGLLAARTSLNVLLDLDLAVIDDAYQAEFHNRQQRAERLAAIGQVAGGIAHELRNPLNVVKTSVYYLLNARNPNPAKTTEHLQRIERHVGLADSVITALSSFARMPLPERKPTVVANLLRECLEINPLPSGVELDFDCPETLPPVLVDVGQMQIVFGNLIRNAREAMPAGGRLSVRGVVGGGAVEVSFGDTGVGIPPEDLLRVMEPLYSTKARGLGLGLALARAILEKNQGTLRVVSTLGQGTTFTVRLMTAE